MSTKNRAVLSTEIVPEVLIKKKNYKEWSFRLRTYLKAQDVWDIIEPTSNEAVDYKVWEKKNATALHAIHISCGPDAFSLIEGIPEAKGAWDKLRELEPQTQPEPETAEEILSSNDGTELYKELYKAVRKPDLNKTEEFINENPGAVRGKITCTKRTALHVAAMAGHLSIVKMLVEKMRKEDLVQLIDGDDLTALAAAIIWNAKQCVAKCMVDKNNELLTIMTYDMLPAALAFRCGHKEMGRYLYTLTPPDYLLQHRKDSATIICYAIYVHSFDVALDLLSKCNELAVIPDKDGVCPLYALANHPSAFKSGYRLKFWQKCLYRCICIDSSLAIKSGKDSPYKVGPKSKGKTLYLLKILGIKDVYDMKKVRIQTSKFICSMSSMIKDLDLNLDKMEKLCVKKALFQAIERGNVEFVEAILKANPELVETQDKSRRSIFMLAIQFRQPKIFSFIYNSNSKLLATSALDIQENNMLHLAAYLAPNTKLNEIPGAALQMQRELQWFHEVRSIVPPWALDGKNNQDKTPSEIFTENHKELVEGEKWMKGTATSCTVVGALIFTVMFAAAFTVPGGNEDSGLPVFLTNKWFLTFIISDSISLFTSTTSVLMFLGILTSKYAEEDFLQSLPRKLMFGLFTLFVSIVSMMVAFSATLFIVLIDRYSWIFYPVICFAFFPGALFAIMQLRLVVEIGLYTYGRGIFDKKARI
nr:uncharacterized protein LOC112490878 isoform X2 [Ziziphus jujuba var. spinosa]